MPLPVLFAFSFAVGFGAVITPGPVSTAIVTESARRGFLVGPLVAAGHCLLELGMIALLALGLAAGLNTPGFTAFVGLLGGGLLIWMGSAMAWGAYRGSIRLPRPGSDARLLNHGQLIGLGAAATLINPFWYAWWITVGATYLAYPAVQALGLTGFLVFYLGHISGDLLWDSILSGVVGRGRRWLTDSAYRWLIAVCGAYLVYLGGVFATAPFTG
jgi:threonine/homoserine/homoserine lactone efflux protein